MRSSDRARCSAPSAEEGQRSVSDKYDEPRAHELRERYHATFGGEQLPVPVESIAEDLLGLAVEARELDVSGMLLPAERRILVNAAEPETRQRFTIAHELGHWICQCLEGTAQPVYCRAEDVGVDPEAKALELEANIFAANLVMPEEAVRCGQRREPVRRQRRRPSRGGSTTWGLPWRGRREPCLAGAAPGLRRRADLCPLGTRVPGGDERSRAAVCRCRRGPEVCGSARANARRRRRAIRGSESQDLLCQARVRRWREPIHRPPRDLGSQQPDGNRQLARRRCGTVLLCDAGGAPKRPSSATP